MFYLIFVGAALLIISSTMIKTYVFTKEDTVNAIKANSILHNVNNIEKIKSIEKKTGITLNNIYELKLPISTYLVKENNLQEITFMNLLQQKVKLYNEKFPLKKANCISLNQEHLLTATELQQCLLIEKKDFNWIIDNSKGLEYKVSDNKIAEKLNLTNKDDNNKIITDNVYLFNNYSNKIVRTKKINDFIKLLLNKKTDYLQTIKIILKIKQQSSKKAIEILENTLNNNNYFNRDDIINKQILKNILYIILNKDGEIIINNNFPNIINFLNKNYNYIYDILDKTTYYNINDKVFNNIKSFLNKG